MKNKKKILYISLLVVDAGITIFLLVISILMLLESSKTRAEILADANKGLIGYLANNPLVYGLAFVVPLFLILAANIIGLVWYVRKSTKEEPVKMDQLTDEQKKALMKEMFADLQKQQTTEPEEKPATEQVEKTPAEGEPSNNK